MTTLTILFTAVFLLMLFNREYAIYKSIKHYFRFRKLVDKECWK